MDVGESYLTGRGSVRSRGSIAHTVRGVAYPASASARPPSAAPLVDLGEKKARGLCVLARHAQRESRLPQPEQLEQRRLCRRERPPLGRDAGGRQCVLDRSEAMPVVANVASDGQPAVQGLRRQLARAHGRRRERPARRPRVQRGPRRSHRTREVAPADSSAASTSARASSYEPTGTRSVNGWSYDPAPGRPDGRWSGG